MNSNNADNLNKKSPEEIEEIVAESVRLKEENVRLKNLLGLMLDTNQIPQSIKKSPDDISNNKKIQIFSNLFHGREDVYAVRWIGKNGKTGYSPTCVNEWSKKLCNKPKVKCSDCENSKYAPITDTVIYNHLTGKQTVGIYPLLLDETCHFLAVDFDKTSWENDAKIFLSVCKEMDIPTAMERSRSGNGAHIWIFFTEKIPAVLARKLGALILTKALDKRYQIGFDSYDRFFPNQDTLPKGGLGNLIALPLQHTPREKGNSVFIDKNFTPYHDQWKFLANIKKMSFEEINTILKKETENGSLIGIRTVADTDKVEDPWTLPPSKKINEDKIFANMPQNTKIIQGNQIYIEKKDLLPKIIKHILGIAAFQNPEFYQAQRMRLSTFGKPRIISCGEDFSEYIGLPRGCFDEIIDFFNQHNVVINLEDKRFYGKPINVTFQGTLRPEQKKAVATLLENDTGVLSVGTAFGKTVIGIYLIALRKVNTLILVHRKQLVEQWIKNISMFLNIPEKSIGRIGGGKNNPTGIIDVGVIQSLFRKGIVKDLIADYGHIIIDECHHISAFSFEQVLKQAKAKYVLGLTATPVRKDGHHPIIIMQCGPIRYKVTEKEAILKMPFEHIVIPRFTNFSIPDKNEVPFQQIYQLLIHSTERNEMIIKDLLETIQNGNSPLLLTERTEQLEYFENRLNGTLENIFVFRGGMGRKQVKELYEKLLVLPADEKRLVIATGRYFGEGFDDERLDTLFLTMPISWHGTLAQYVGRLHRLHDSKKQVVVFDYVDVNVPQLKNMYHKRVKGYKALGYKINEQQNENSFTEQLFHSDANKLL